MNRLKYSSERVAALGLMVIMMSLPAAYTANAGIGPAWSAAYTVEQELRNSRGPTTDELVGGLKKSLAFMVCFDHAQRGNAKAQFNLGLMYDTGIGVSPNIGEALKWYVRAATNRDGRAQQNLGVMYLTGRGVVKNEKKAYEWCLRSAIQGVPEAQMTIGGMYEKGIAVERDMAKAVGWYRKAAAQGLEGAEVRLDALKRAKLTP